MWCGGGDPNNSPPTVLPEVLARPWVLVSSALDMPPVLTYAAYNLLNFRRLDPTGSVELGNLAVQHVSGWWPACLPTCIHACVRAARLQLQQAVLMRSRHPTRPSCQPSTCCTALPSSFQLKPPHPNIPLLDPTHCVISINTISNSWGAWMRRGSGLCMWQLRQLLHPQLQRCSPCRRPPHRFVYGEHKGGGRPGSVVALEGEVQGLSPC